ncbi:MAG: ATP-binding protein [Candidatus Sphingomonas phytovorans]|nr:ATP-binding protein [Sphingomonas sp.]WEK01144.1 MAG: ATP-binding protein [Sphingomonas sp.]
MAGRLFVFLLIGVVGSAALALALADRQRQSDLYRIRFERLVDRMSDFLSVADKASEPLRVELLANGVTGIRRATGEEHIERRDNSLTKGLAVRWKGPVRAERATPGSCFAGSPIGPAGDRFDCWVVTARLSDGGLIKLQLRGHVQADRIALNPVVVLVLAVLMATLAFIAARMAAAPLGDLARAATALGGDLDRLPLPERGPREVRDAARAFNTMQTRLRSYVVERTQLLASITHDLQTPMTRLRLRLEKVSDSALRSRLIDDLGTMQALIREGLDYARSNQTTEPFANLAIDQLLDLAVEDASEGGPLVRFIARSDCDVEARPRALQRCLANLIDNAIKYGGSAEVSATRAAASVLILIRDRGPGIPEEKLDHVFEPFVRLEALPSVPSDGIGLGLAIARTLAEKNGATLILRNHPEGGLEAVLTLYRGIVPHPLGQDAPFIMHETS